MKQVTVLNESGALVPARAHVEKLSASLRTQLTSLIEELETTGAIKRQWVTADGPGRYKVQVRDDENHLKSFILQTEDVLKPDEKFFGRRNELVFVISDFERWQYPQRTALWLGRPGEETFQIPWEVEEVLQAIRNGIPKPEYKRCSNGSFEIKIERGADLRIYGSAVWK